MPDDIPVQPGFIPIDLDGIIDDGLKWDTGKGRSLLCILPVILMDTLFWLESSGILFSVILTYRHMVLVRGRNSLDHCACEKTGTKNPLFNYIAPANVQA